MLTEDCLVSVVWKGVSVLKELYADYTAPHFLALSEIDDPFAGLVAKERGSACECGAKSVGHSRHSTWCPKHND